MAVADYFVENISVAGQDLPQVVHERESVEFIDKTLEVARDRNPLVHSLLQLIPFEILGKIENLEQGLEHPGGRPGRRNEFHEPALRGSRGVQMDTFP